MIIPNEVEDEDVDCMKTNISALVTVLRHFHFGEARNNTEAPVGHLRHQLAQKLQIRFLELLCFVEIVQFAIFNF